MLYRHIFLLGKGVNVIHPQNAEQIEQMTKLSATELPEGVEAEYMEQLRMFHRSHSSGGPMPLHMLIPLLRSFGMSSPGSGGTEQEQVKWGDRPVGTRVVVAVAGQRKKGEFKGVVAGGTIAVRLDDDSKVMELRPDRVRIDTSIPEDINQQSMKNEIDDKKPVKAEEDELPQHWSEESPDYVLVDGKPAILVGETPNNSREYTVEIDGEFRSVPKGLVADAS